MKHLYLHTCDVITLFYVCLPGLYINTLSHIYCHETCFVFRADHRIQMSGHQYYTVIGASKLEFTHTMEVSSKTAKKD
jgi:hypothetical protein